MPLTPRSWLKSLRLRPVDQRYALIEACLIGLISALAALALKEGIDWLGSYRIRAANEFGGAIVLPIAGLVFGFCAGLIVDRFSPEASGSGIPQVKAALAQFPVLLSLRVALVKLVGTILVLGAGLPLGRRGPTVHIGAALAAQLSTWVPTSSEHRRQMIAAGAAAGLAAGFNTPIAGIFFVVEELMRDLSGLTLETAILASFTGAVVSRLIGSAGLSLPSSLARGSWETAFSLPEIPFFLLLGILTGILGAVFNRAVLFCVRINRRSGLSLPWRVALASLIAGLIVAFLPPFFRNNAGMREFLITGEGGWQTTAIALVAYFFLTLLAYGSGAPGGLFAPALVLGSALGYLVGIAETALMGTGSVHTYALAGMGAFFTAVIRVPVTAIIIVFELTGDFEVVLPLMIGSAVAYIVAESVFSGSLYQHLLAAQGILLDDEATVSGVLTGLTAGDIMQTKVETLSSHLTLDQARKAFTESPHRGFPVVDDGRLMGIVTQSDLAQLTSQPGYLSLREIMTPRPVTVSPTAPISEVIYLLNRYQLSHLPVAEGQRLLGIITRGDIIRAQTAQPPRGGPAEQTGGQAEPSYLTYRTRSPAVGRGRLLLPLANQDTAPALLQMALAIAHQRQAELECLQVVEIPRHRSPSQTWIDTDLSRELLQKAEQLGRAWEVPVHTQLRIAHDVAQTILDTIAARQISLVIMGWNGSTSTPGRIFGNIVDTIIQQAPCDVILVKLSQSGSPLRKLRTRWLIPIAGGPNAQRALQLLGDLSAWARSASPGRKAPSREFWLCQVYPPNLPEPETANLEHTAALLHDQLKVPVTPIPIRAYSVSDAIVSLANTEHCDVVVLGASREGLLQQALHGNIPEAIAQGVEGTVIVVRGALS